MPRLYLFLVASLLGGLGGLVGSMVGGALDHLFVGGFVGGVVIAPVTAGLARWRGWIAQSDFWPTTVGAALGFLAAAALAVNTLSSPVGPVVGTTLTGFGALLGQFAGRMIRRREGS
jgi:hypothetical protein